eukprot:15249572-Alexandrium_andersonii.AAC.1
MSRPARRIADPLIGVGCLQAAIDTYFREVGSLDLAALLEPLATKVTEKSVLWGQKVLKLIRGRSALVSRVSVCEGLGLCLRW